MEPIAFTPAGPGDADALFDLFCRVRAHDLGALSWPEAIRATTLRIQFDAQRASYARSWPDATTSFLVRGGVRAGWATVDRSGPYIHVLDIAVLPATRGQGVGTAAMRALLAEAARDGRRVVLSVQRTNLPAIRMYSRLGFEPTAAEEMYLHLEWRPPASAPAPGANAAPAFSAETFRAAVDTWFEVVQDGPLLLLPLKEVSEHAPSGGFARFSLIFHGPGDRALPQGLYTLRHPVVGEQAIFLGPVTGSTPERIVYEACFSVPQRPGTP